MRNVLLAVCLAFTAGLTLVGCNSDQRAAERAVRENLKDPESARFGDFYYNKKTHKGCLAVNAKNSMGGYTGDQLAYVEKTDEGWQVYDIADISFDMCRKIHADDAG